MTEEEWKKFTEEYDQINDSFKLEEKDNRKFHNIEEFSLTNLDDINELIAYNNFSSDVEELDEDIFENYYRELKPNIDRVMNKYNAKEKEKNDKIKERELKEQELQEEDNQKIEKLRKFYPELIAIVNKHNLNIYNYEKEDSLPQTLENCLLSTIINYLKIKTKNFCLYEKQDFYIFEQEGK